MTSGVGQEDRLNSEVAEEWRIKRAVDKEGERKWREHGEWT